jgi:TorA maturation chaperone TorD
LITEKTELSAQNMHLTLTGELLMFTLLGKILLQIPEKSWLQPLLDDGIFAEAPFAEQQADVIQGLRLLNRWSQDFQGDISQESLTDLKADYTRLFTGHTKIPVAPWESVFFTEERLVFQAQTQDVREWYRRFGLEVDNQFMEPEDHIGLELTFIGHLAKLGLEALILNNDAELEQVLAAQRDFAARHLFLWAPLWCKLMGEYAQTDFYRGLSLVVNGMLIELAAVLNVSMPMRIRS